jgi:hypothetical protein
MDLYRATPAVIWNFGLPEKTPVKHEIKNRKCLKTSMPLSCKIEKGYTLDY